MIVPLESELKILVKNINSDDLKTNQKLDQLYDYLDEMSVV